MRTTSEQGCFAAGTAAAIADRLLAWYDRHRRLLPWREPPGARADPYRVWVSEIMLQQTTVATVIPYFARFLARWPSVAALAAAELDGVLQVWQGLGYYARAHNLHACARHLVERCDGRWPESEEGLRRLPGIGAYTAAAIAAIAFDQRTLPVDGNVTRVVARLLALATPLPAARPTIQAAARGLAPSRRPGDFAQAMMDLGATICVPREPRCVVCPLQGECRAFALGLTRTLPITAAKPVRPTRYGLVYWLERADGAILLRRRPERGLLGGLMELPTSEWRSAPWPSDEANAPTWVRDGRPLPGVVRHTFSHFHLELTVVVGQADLTSAPAGQWVRPVELAAVALPTVMRKVIEKVRNAGVDGAGGEGAGAGTVAARPIRRRRRAR